MRTKIKNQSGQALVEMTVGLIAFAVIFLAILLTGDLCRARMNCLLESRKDAGTSAIGGTLSGTPGFFGGADAFTRLQTDVAAPLDETISYSQYTTPNYTYMEKNPVAALYNPNGEPISAFNLTMGEQTQYVTNSEFLVNMNVGPAKITIQQQTCLPILKGFQ